jgi:hypothetical protein
MSQATPNSLNVTQFFGSSTTLGPRQVAILELLRRSGPMTRPQMLNMMGMKVGQSSNQSAFESLVSRGYLRKIALDDMPKKIREKVRTGVVCGTVLYTITAAGLGIRRVLANVGGTGNHLGLVAIGARQLSME